MRLIVLLGLTVFMLGQRPLQPGVGPIEAAQEVLLPPPLDLPEIVRTLLRPRMLRHARSLAMINAALAREHWGAVAYHAEEIAEESRIARPVLGPHTVNAAIPEAFFKHQAELHDWAEMLAGAADAGHATRIAETYDGLYQTCARCHGDFVPVPEVRP